MFNHKWTSIVFCLLCGVGLASAAPRFWVLADIRYDGLTDAEVKQAEAQSVDLIKYVERNEQVACTLVGDDWYITPKRASLLLSTVVFKRQKTYSVVVDVVNLETSIISERLAWENLKMANLFNKFRRWIDTEDPIGDTPSSLKGFDESGIVGLLYQYREQNLKKEFEDALEVAIRDMATFLIGDKQLKFIDKGLMSKIGEINRNCSTGRFAGKIEPGKMIMGKYLLQIAGEQKLPFEFKVLKLRFLDTKKNEEFRTLEVPMRNRMNHRKLAGNVYTILQVRR